MQSNDCYCAIAAAMTVCMVQQPPLPQQTFFQLLQVMDPRAVDPLLKHIPDAVVHRIQIWWIRWPHLWRDKLWRLSLCSMVTCHVHDVLVPHLGNFAEKRSNPRKQSRYPAEAYLAELYSGNSHVDLNPIHPSIHVYLSEKSNQNYGTYISTIKIWVVQQDTV